MYGRCEERCGYFPAEYIGQPPDARFMNGMPRELREYNQPQSELIPVPRQQVRLVFFVSSFPASLLSIA